MKNNAQTVSIDIIITIGLFLAIFAFLIMVWQNQNAITESQLRIQEMNTLGSRALDFMVKSTGETTSNTTNWEDETDIGNVRFIGLAKGYRAVTKEKALKFSEYIKSDYEATKAKILLLGNMDYYFRLYYQKNGNEITIKEDGIELEGGEIASSPETIIVLKRAVSFEGNEYNGPAIAELKLSK